MALQVERDLAALRQCSRILSGSVSSPWMNWKALKGLMAQPMSRSKTTLARSFSVGKRWGCAAQSKLPPAARIGQTVAHIALPPTNAASGLRFALYFMQAVCMIAMGIVITARLAP